MLIKQCCCTPGDNNIKSKLHTQQQFPPICCDIDTPFVSSNVDNISLNVLLILSSYNFLKATNDPDESLTSSPINPWQTK